MAEVVVIGAGVIGGCAAWYLGNLILATGHAMIGVSLGPVTGKLVAQLAAGATPLIDLEPLRAERFSS
jgi:D-amino-acid dehydrogenase